VDIKANLKDVMFIMLGFKLMNLALVSTLVSDLVMIILYVSFLYYILFLGCFLNVLITFEQLKLHYIF